MAPYPYLSRSQAASVRAWKEESSRFSDLTTTSRSVAQSVAKMASSLTTLDRQIRDPLLVPLP